LSSLDERDAESRSEIDHFKNQSDAVRNHIEEGEKYEGG